MSTSNAIAVHGKPIAGGKLPLICTPLTGKTREAVLAELETILPKKPDVIEWRVDFFEPIATVQKVIEAGKAIRDRAGGTPIIFTRRSAKEGGQAVPMSEAEVVELYCQVCASRTVDIIDYELCNPEENMKRLREASKQADIGLIASYHNFKYTPSADAIREKLLQAEVVGADIAKVAVMPRSLDDVLVVLEGTLQARQEMKIPIISMSMGAYGSLTRMFGFAFGSALTFAVGQSSSAPGQVPIEDLRTVLEILRRSLGGAALP
jgi:3-dehydroquinate dehydratase I